MIAFRQDFEHGFAQNVRGMFGKEGLLSSAKNFEYRPEQQQMAAAVAEALEGKRHLVVEAGLLDHLHLAFGSTPDVAGFLLEGDVRGEHGLVAVPVLGIDAAEIARRLVWTCISILHRAAA